MTTQEIPWNLIYTGIITVAVSGILSYILAKRKERNKIKINRFDTYKKLIDLFSEDGAKCDSQVNLVDQVLRDRSLFEPKIKKILPASFNGMYAHKYTYGTIEGPEFTEIVFRGKGSSTERNIECQCKEDPTLFFWFEDKNDIGVWTEIAENMLKNYNKHTKDNLKVDGWKFRLVPKDQVISQK